jgi:hypothetical protein
MDAQVRNSRPQGSDALRSKEAELVQRILATQRFVHSAFLTNFLLYICDRKFEGREDEITEHQIGIRALGRSDSYNTGDDNIVRNYARILRKRLEEYFADEGRNEPLRIVIPSGHYVPIFEVNTLAPSDVSDSVEPETDPAQSLVAGASGKLGIGALRHSMRRYWMPAALLLAVCIATPIYLAIHTRSPHLYDLFWEEILDRSRATYIIPADSGFSIMQDISGKEMHLFDYVSGNPESTFPWPNLAKSGKNGAFRVPSLSNLTSTADLAIVAGIARLPQFLDSGARVTYAHDIRMEDLQHSNVILIGGPHSNPWVELFEPESNFRMDFLMYMGRIYPGGRSFVNKHPLPNEQPAYSNISNNEPHVTYALVSFLPSIDGAGHVLLLEGEGMAGTQAAGDFLLDQRDMNPILAKARLPDGSIGPFEVLLQTSEVGASAPEARIVVERFSVYKASK